MESPRAKPQSTSTSQSHVRVVLKVRPFLPSEFKNGETLTPCIFLLDRPGDEVTVHIKDQLTSRNEIYKLDSIFGQDDLISQIFHKEVFSMISGIFHGINATIFVYGATGSGKTYTMQGTEIELGLIPLAVAAILSSISGSQFLVEFSYYEVYLDRCYDLLEPKAKEIMALDDKDGKVQLKGLSWLPVSSLVEFNESYSIGVQRRKVAHTELNDVSSRSHAVLTIAVRNGDVKGKLNLIDLAGNEDNKRTCNEGIRLQESAKINQSLFALSNVIHALNNNEPRIPYRESKLTRILQDSLGGESRALMIACLNPGSYQEAAHTVSLAARSRQVVNYVGSAKRKEVPKESVDMEAKLRAWLESKGKTRNIQRMNVRTPNPISYSKDLRSSCTSVKLKDAESISTSSKGRKLFDSEALVASSIEVTNENLEDESFVSRNLKYTEKNLESHGSQKKVLLPIKPSNYQLPDDDSTSLFLLDSKTPSRKCGFNETSTPLDKFKESLVEDYISFLNVANKMELMQLKGIGQKRAECILELRKDSSTPIKSLSDLEQIGLSSKQVQDLLKTGTRGMFA
ncbi:Kinesin-1-like protein PSS1 [Platanthera zijinensis]|uniref:Kinesin-like protein n=1 Tax=Platanthera zijinensis TaxID=2320716 RepID=A0AAP0G6F9_9ASPA